MEQETAGPGMMGVSPETSGVSPENPLGVDLKECFLLAEERVEMNWTPVDMEIPEALEYLSGRHDIPVTKTEAQSIQRGVPIEYLFTADALWRGVRCPKKVWGYLMRAAGATNEQVEAFLKKAEGFPKKRLDPIP